MSAPDTNDDRQRDLTETDGVEDPDVWRAREARQRGVDPAIWEPYALRGACENPWDDCGYLVPDPWTDVQAWTPTAAYPPGPRDRYHGGVYGDEFVLTDAYDTKAQWIAIDAGEMVDPADWR